VHVLVAPDKFRGTLSAAQAAAAITTGWRRVRPDDELVELPLADGGEGTTDALVDALGGARRRVRVSGPLGDLLEAEFGVVEGAGGRTAIVEMARASGLALLSPGRRDPLRASTRGTGELILAACAERPVEVVIAVGGSATTDGGAGMAQALGVRLLDARGDEVPPGGGGLLELARIDATRLDHSVRGVRFSVARDVDNPITGPQGAAHVFSPQKGASPEDVVLLDRALAHLAAVIHRDLAIDVRGIPGGGAGGGLGAGLVAFLGARLRPGIEVVMTAVGFERALSSADVVVTGEGAFDATSLRGKVPGGVLAAARDAGVPAAVVCGRADGKPEGARIWSLVERVGEERALGDTRLALEELAAEVAAAMVSGGLSSGP
jgi:glycerate kinase